MRRLAILSLVTVAPILPAEAALAQSPATGPDITVTGDNRITCRRITRTATRMRTGRICRTQAQWARERAPGVDPNDPSTSLEATNDTLTQLGANERSTGDGNGGHDGPLGPR
jgi:hypothetical protein